MIETLIAKIGLPILINIVAEALGGVDTPVTKGAAEALKSVDKAIQTGQVSDDQITEANRHVESIAKMQAEADASKIAEINKSLRSEIESQDKYVRRMRPTFGYLMAVTWAAQMLGLAWVIVFETEKSGLVLNAMGNLSAIWAVGLSVLGIYVYKRSEDKKLKGPETIFWNDPK